MTVQLPLRCFFSLSLLKCAIAAATEKRLSLLVVCEQLAKNDLVADPLNAVEQDRHEEGNQRQEGQ